ncbi:MAG: LTA synthase family protein [Planctomycetota bacterium]
MPARAFRRIAAAAAKLGLLHCRTRVPGLVFVAVVAILQVQRLGLTLWSTDQLAGVPLADVAQAFLVGLRFDLVIAGMAALPLLIPLAFAPPPLIKRSAFKWAVATVAGLLVTAVVAVAAADALFYDEFGLRLNHQVVNYLPNAGNAYIYQVIWDEYPVTPLGLGLLAALALSAWGVRQFGFDDELNVGPIWQAVVWPLTLGLAMGLGVRGTVSSHALNAGPAYFTTSNTLSQLTLNGGFTLREAISNYVRKVVPLDAMYDLLPPDDVDRVVRELVVTDADTLVPDPVNPLRRTTDTGRPRRDLNVLLVVLESVHWAYVGHLGGLPDHTPQLDAIARDGVAFTHAYAVGGRTQRGYSGALASFPDIPVASATTRPESADTFRLLPTVLRERGYQTLFIYGGPAHRDHRQTFLGSNGFDAFHVENDLPVRTFRTKLGYNDDDLFQSAIQILGDLPDDRPFFANLLTLTFHQPYTFPGSDQLDLPDEPAEERAAVRFSDEALGRFMEAAKHQAWFEDTLFVFVADHGGGALEKPKGPAMFRVPMVLYAPGLEELQPQTIDRLATQMDLAPTVMGLLGGTYEHSFFGRDQLADPSPPPYAVTITDGEEIILYTAPDRATLIRPRDADHAAVRFDPESPKILETTAAETGHVHTGVALVQLAQRLFDRGRFNLNAPPAPASPSPQAAAIDR